jgi:hypothetical protein
MKFNERSTHFSTVDVKWKLIKLIGFFPSTFSTQRIRERIQLVKEIMDFGQLPSLMKEFKDATGPWCVPRLRLSVLSSFEICFFGVWCTTFQIYTILLQTRCITSEHGQGDRVAVLIQRCIMLQYLIRQYLGKEKKSARFFSSLLAGLGRGNSEESEPRAP